MLPQVDGMEKYFGAIMKYVQKKNGIDMMLFHNFNTLQDYIDYIFEQEHLKHFKAPVTEDGFLHKLGYYSARELLPPEAYVLPWKGETEGS